MATLTASGLYSIEFDIFYDDPYSSQLIYSRTANQIKADFRTAGEPFRDVFVGGADFRFAANGVPVSGTVHSITEFDIDGKVYEITGLKLAMGDLKLWFGDGYSFLGVSTIFNGHDSLHGSPFNDYMDGWDGNDRMYGGRGEDVLYGSGGNDVMFGELDDDQLFGFDNNDILVGGPGDDLLSGGNGIDTVVVSGPSRFYELEPTSYGFSYLNGPDGRDALFDVEIIECIDGRLTFNPTDNFARVDRLYLAAFDRGPDTIGINNWAKALEAGMSLESVASSFIGSAEFASRYGHLNNAQFVSLLYQNVLDRQADLAGSAHWVAAINNGMSRASTLTAFAESPEFIAKTAGRVRDGLWDIDETAASVARLYCGVLDRLPDAAGLKAWADAADNGLPLVTIAGSFVASAEFQQRYGSLSNSGFVSHLYHNVLERSPDAAGLNAWLAYLGAGAGRANVTLGFTESFEFQIKTLPFIEEGIMIA